MSTASPGPPGISNYKPSITSQEPSPDLQDTVKHPHSIVIPLFGQVIIDAPYSVQTKKWPKPQWKNICMIFFLILILTLNFAVAKWEFGNRASHETPEFVT